MESNFWNISNITISMHGSKQKLFQLNCPPERKVFVVDFGWRIHNCSLRGMGVWLWKQSNNKKIFNFLTVSIVIEMSQMLVFQLNHPLKKSCLRLGYWGTNQVYIWREITVQIPIKFVVFITFYIFVAMRILMPGTKSILCNWNSSPRLKTLLLRSWIKT